MKLALSALAVGGGSLTGLVAQSHPSIDPSLWTPQTIGWLVMLLGSVVTAMVSAVQKVDVEFTLRPFSFHVRAAPPPTSRPFDQGSNSVLKPCLIFALAMLLPMFVGCASSSSPPPTTEPVAVAVDPGLETFSALATGAALDAIRDPAERKAAATVAHAVAIEVRDFAVNGSLSLADLQSQLDKLIASSGIKQTYTLTALSRALLAQAQQAVSANVSTSQDVAIRTALVSVAQGAIDATGGE